MTAAAGPDIVEDGLVLSLDAANIRCYSPNVHPLSLDIFKWTSDSEGGVRATISRDSILSPVGESPLKAVPTVDGQGGYTNTYGSPVDDLADAADGETWTFSFWAKANKSIGGGAFIFGANSSGVNVENLSQTFSFTTVWQRYEITGTFSNPLVASIQVRVDWDGDTTAIYWFDGFQVEKASAATDFNPNYFGNNVIDLSGNNSSVTSYLDLSTSEKAFDFTFDGTNARAGLSIANNNFSLSDFTMESTFKINGTHFHYDGALMSSGNWNNTHWAFSVSQGSTSIKSRKPTISRAYSFSVGQWYRATFRRSGTDVSYFVNGELVGTVSSFSNIPLTSNASNTAIGRETYANGYFNFNGLISTSSIYNRALSDDEIGNNFDAIRGRYGL